MTFGQYDIRKFGLYEHHANKGPRARGNFMRTKPQFRLQWNKCSSTALVDSEIVLQQAETCPLGYTVRTAVRAIL
ncbi:Piso0_003869 [Millerozyma farinosa CBS 7064]|uniref:Piso0_003869 protein n=1 Tax=Pichia sorbitophila (strain ATCC MYA-4447 / BCRC 22081 / CBS 7064 / NBRC 10061 / NRRL Y-12695) TaxID=559304 RepID=G8Y6U6_PICSO|nr:Piso0_003869 [Millerozyma farinosa CBS 7064]CCE84326.1 Piso0_003869 [Millerozyma farinosa CBS 7064]